MTKEQKSPEDIAHRIVHKWDKKNFSINYIPLLTLIDLADQIAAVIKNERAKALTTKELSDNEIEKAMDERYFVDDALGRASRLDFKEGVKWALERIGKRE